jgi:hypothetical protein
VRAVLISAVLALFLAAAAAADTGQPPLHWLAQAQCIHRHEGPWTANTGNGYFGGMQFAAATWLGMKGSKDPALVHPGNPAYPFRVPMVQQLHVAWLIWAHDGRTWKSWGAVGAACSKSS